MGQMEMILAGCKTLATGRARVLHSSRRRCKIASSASAQTRVGGDQCATFCGPTVRMLGPLMMSVKTWRTGSMLAFVLKKARYAGDAVPRFMSSRTACRLDCMNGIRAWR